MMQLTEQQKIDGWRIVKFGEIAKSVSKRVLPGDTDLEVYVGLEHLDPDNLRITRRGVPSDVTGQKLRVRPGQIIFGKRRAYQRKVAVADFDGICSAHAMVLEAIPKAVLPEYLPFFMQSDMFMERAVSISEGSLSPTIKWKTLANQEFPLPPRKRQEEILTILEKIENIRLLNGNIIPSFDKFLSVLTQQIFNKTNKTYSLRNIAEVFASPVNKKSVKGQPSVLLCNYMDVYSNRDIHSKIDFMKATASEKEIARFQLMKNDVVITKDSEDPKDIAIPACITEDIPNLVCGYHLVIIRPNPNKIMGRYLFHILNSRWARHTFFPFAQGSTRYGIVSDAYEKIKIPVPTLDEQMKFADALDSLNQQREIINNRDLAYSNMQKKIIDKELLGGIS
ncbi:MAG: restriction endonuclease subunit S [Hyphomicrobiales bacterium]